MSLGKGKTSKGHSYPRYEKEKKIMGLHSILIFHLSKHMSKSLVEANPERAKIFEGCVS